MGQKVNPIGYRLALTKDWRSKWYANPKEFPDFLHSDIADRASWSPSGVGSMAAALFLREFLGDRVDHWAHLDMSAPAWVDASDGELTKGATGWGARMLLAYLSAADSR